MMSLNEFSPNDEEKRRQREGIPLNIAYFTLRQSGVRLGLPFHFIDGPFRLSESYSIEKRLLYRVAVFSMVL